MKQPTPEQIRSFVETFYDADLAHGQFVLWESASKSSSWHDVDDIEGIHTNVLFAIEHNIDLYFNISLQDPEGCVPGKDGQTYKRGTNKGVTDIPGFAIDLDYGTLGHKGVTAENKGAAEAFLRALPLKPSLVIHSGGGFHVYWLFHEMEHVDTEEKRLFLSNVSALWNDLIHAMARKEGFGIDATHDLARVLRVPYTYNHKKKSKARKVSIVHPDPRLIDDPSAISRYSLDDFLFLLPVEEQQGQHAAWQALPETEHKAARVAYARKTLSERRRDDFACELPLEEDLVRRMVEAIPGGRPRYDEWIAYIAAIRRATGDDLLTEEICREKWPEEQDGEYGRISGLNEGQVKTLYWAAHYQGGFEATPDERVALALDPSFRFVLGTKKKAGDATPAPQDAEEKKKGRYPYSVREGMLVRHVARGKRISIEPVADFDAAITGEIRYESGETAFVIQGTYPEGGTFDLEISVEDFADNKTFLAEITKATRASARVFDPRHLRLGIQSHSNGHVKVTRFYGRTGWSDDGFLLPGLHEENGHHIELPHTCQGYQATEDGELEQGIEALRQLTLLWGNGMALPAIAYHFLAPAATLGGLGHRRFALFYTGETGAFKTAFNQCLLGLWGDFVTITGWDRSTHNALTEKAASVADIVFLIDNFKRKTNGGSKKLIEFLHNALEGSSKERLDRTGKLRQVRSLRAWPLITGEDLPHDDAAALARSLTIEVRSAGDNGPLTQAQKLQEHLGMVGTAYLRWLQTGEGRHAAEDIFAMFTERRSYWGEVFRADNAVNPYRQAENLAMLDLGFRMICAWPVLQEVFMPLRETWECLLEDLAALTNRNTSASSEGALLLELLSKEISSGEGVFLERKGIIPSDLSWIAKEADRRTVLGWVDIDHAGNPEAFHVLVPVLRKLAQRDTYFESLGNVGEAAIGGYLEKHKLLAKTQRGRLTNVVWVEGRTARVYSLVPEAVMGREIEGDEFDDEVGF